jgi:hypothetical protein
MTRRSGSANIEFALVGIPVMMALISIFEISRAMWTYHSLAHTVRQTTRYVAVHGHGCAVAPQECTVTVGDIARRARGAAVGLSSSEMALTISATNGAVECAPLDECLSDESVWPAFPGNMAGMEVTVSARYPFQSVLLMIWPGAGTTGGVRAFSFPASSTDTIAF